MNPTIKHILFFEPRIEGHHLAWLPLIAEAMLDAGYRLTDFWDSLDVFAEKTSINAFNSAILKGYPPRHREAKKSGTDSV